MYEEFLRLIILILPAYVANAVPVVFGGGASIDFKAVLFDGKRVFGDSKTWRGLFSAILFGTLAGATEGYLCSAGVIPSEFCLDYLKLGFLMACGAMFGDLLGSFIKRRMGAPSGHPSIILDQLTFLAFALIFILPFLPAGYITLAGLAFLTVLTYVLHISTNYIANRLGLKKVPW